jgi:D-threo-aldose 1-dehydrogenase
VIDLRAMPPLGLGTAPLGGLYTEVDEDEAHAVVRRAWEHGVRVFDTAPHYGAGLAEQRLGAVLRQLPRDEIVVCSKVGRVLQRGRDRDFAKFFRGSPALHPEFDFSADGVRRSLESSLERLGIDRLDVVHVHDPDDHGDQAVAEAIPELARMRDEGIIGAVGAGMNQVEMLVRFAEETDVDCFLVAGRYTLLDQSAGRDLLPLCAERGISVIIGGVFNSGILADPKPGARYDYAPADADLVARARRLQGICARHGVALAAAAVQLPIAHPAVTTVLVGARSTREVDEDVALFNQPIPDDLWAELRAEGLLDG